MLFLWVIFDMYIFSISFKNRYSTNFIDSNYINHQKKIDIDKSDRFIVLPSNWDNVMYTIKRKWINKVVILKDYKYVISGTSYEKNTQDLIKEMSKYYNSIYDDNRISLLDIWKRQYFIIQTDLLN